MFSKERNNFMINVQHALNLPIRVRCAELTVLLDKGNILEMQRFFPVLIDHIFGPQGTLSWGLRSTTEYECEDFRQLQHFLSPCGPLFKLIYTLLKEPGIKYDFSLQYLPTKIQQFLENSQNHPFYSDLIHVNPQMKHVMSLLLNPFDYYMFHFAYHLINPWHQRVNSANSTWNTVYYVLCCDYLLHFLPTDPNANVLPIIYYNGKCPVQNVQPLISSRNTFGTGLLNSSAINKSIEESFHKNLERHPRNDIWRSETVLTVFTDMWLHNDQITQQSNALNGSLNSSPNQQSRRLHFNELPTGEYMRIMRVLIKQLHSFSVSSKADDTHLCELKQIAIPMIQGKFYIFLRNLIHKWPLDGSFRLVLELWLTYIQPWRYLPNNLVKQKNHTQFNPDADDIAINSTVSAVDKEYLPFIAENLLAYVVIFQQLLPRFTRVDLVSPKMSLMLHRITKVFNQPNLASYIQEVENCVENNHSPTHHKYNSHWQSSLPPLSPTANWSTNTSLLEAKQNQTMNQDSPRKHGFNPPVNSTAFLNATTVQDKKWLAVVRQKIFELEGPNFCYKPLLCCSPAVEVYDLIYQLKRAIQSGIDLVDSLEKENEKRFSGFWGYMKYMFSTPVLNDEFSLAERKKVPAYLEISLKNLMNIFQISEIQEREPEVTNVGAGLDFSNDFKFLTPERVRNRIRNIKYEGDPDLLPIGSYESTFLVRSLYKLAVQVNQSYGPLFYRMYYTPTYMGRLSRQFLCPPMTVYHYDKTLPGSPRVGKNLPPRISFRVFAGYKFLTYLVFGYFIAMLFGFGFFSYLAILLIVFMLIKMMKAIPKTGTPVHHNYPTQGFGNISFNDSF